MADLEAFNNNNNQEVPNASLLSIPATNNPGLKNEVTNDVILTRFTTVSDNKLTDQSNDATLIDSQNNYIDRDIKRQSDDLTSHYDKVRRFADDVITNYDDISFDKVGGGANEFDSASYVGQSAGSSNAGAKLIDKCTPIDDINSYSVNKALHLESVSLDDEETKKRLCLKNRSENFKQTSEKDQNDALFLSSPCSSQKLLTEISSQSSNAKSKSSQSSASDLFIEETPSAIPYFKSGKNAADKINFCLSAEEEFPLLDRHVWRGRSLDDVRRRSTLDGEDSLSYRFDTACGIKSHSIGGSALDLTANYRQMNSAFLLGNGAVNSGFTQRAQSSESLRYSTSDLKLLEIEMQEKLHSQSFTQAHDQEVDKESVVAKLDKGDSIEDDYDVLEMLKELIIAAKVIDQSQSQTIDRKDNAPDAALDTEALQSLNKSRRKSKRLKAENNEAYISRSDNDSGYFDPISDRKNSRKNSTNDANEPLNSVGESQSFPDIHGHAKVAYSTSGSMTVSSCSESCTDSIGFHSDTSGTYGVTPEQVKGVEEVPVKERPVSALDIEDTMPKLNWCFLEDQLKKAIEKESLQEKQFRRHEIKREDVRRQLCSDDWSNDWSSNKMDLPIRRKVHLRPKRPHSFARDRTMVQTKEQLENNLHLTSTLMSETAFPVVKLDCKNPENFFEMQMRMQAETRLALAQVRSMAHMQFAMEQKTRKKTGLDYLLGHKTEKSTFLQILSNLNIAQLLLVVNDLLGCIEDFNEDLVRELVLKDDLHMAQDSMLVDIEDITRRAEEFERRRHEKEMNLFRSRQQECEKTFQEKKKLSASKLYK